MANDALGAVAPSRLLHLALTPEGMQPVANERATEDIVREHLKIESMPGQQVEEQTSSVPAIRNALAAASKSGHGSGRPEFIVTFPCAAPKLVLLFECKADTAKHESPHRNRAADFAVDGVLHYMSHVSRHFDVIGVAVSGLVRADLRISTFRQLRGEGCAEPLPSHNGPVTSLLSVALYPKLLTYDPLVRARTEAELLAFSRTLHNYMRDYAKLSEAEKPLVVSGILLALRDDAFSLNWPSYQPSDLAKELFWAIARAAKDANIDEDKREVMLTPYRFVCTHPELSKLNNQGESPLKHLIGDINTHVRPFQVAYNDVDIIGRFYDEFLRYTGGDKKGLGIVLTPRHLTELFANIANVRPSDVIVDTAAGTGGFLISAMMEMDSKSTGDSKTREETRKHHLVGVEQQPHMFALGIANMILRGDGKTNLYQGSCFDGKIISQLKQGVPGRHDRPNIGLINPPFGQKGEGLHELNFVENLLDILRPGGTAVVVLPMSCAYEPHPARHRLLEHHTLVAQMSLPNDLFHPVGVITCAMVFAAHQPHRQSRQPTWFGYWKDDGFVKTKDRGRIDLNHRWPEISKTWLDSYHGRLIQPGFSVTRTVTADDEWCAEKYMETDYSRLAQSDFEHTLDQYAIFKLLYAHDYVDDGDDAT